MCVCLAPTVLVDNKDPTRVTRCECVCVCVTSCVCLAPTVPADKKDPTRVTRSAQLPLLRPGPFAPLCNPHPTYQDRWAFRTCSLWQVPPGQDPTSWSNTTRE